MIRMISSLCVGLGLVACSDSTGPADQLQGSWELVGYSDAGTPGATTGTAVFHGNGTFSIVGTVTYPGEPTDDLSVTGTWSAQGDEVILTTGGITDRWVVAAGANRVVLTLKGSQPPTTMTLSRPGP